MTLTSWLDILHKHFPYTEWEVVPAPCDHHTQIIVMVRHKRTRIAHTWRLKRYEDVETLLGDIRSYFEARFEESAP